jgi:solute carrier family 13 (sodium-dependent dicarboxylate transporter), member 2/3/5
MTPRYSGTVIRGAHASLAPLLRRFGLWVAAAFLLAAVLMPPRQGLPVAGQRMIGVLVFAVLVWMTEAISYEVSAVVILSLIALLLGFSPDPAAPAAVIGTAKGLVAALDGFANPATVLVAAATFLSAGMMMTGLDRRIALLVLSRVGSKTRNLLIGIILVCMVLSFFIPSTTARVACLVPIVLGIVQVFGLSRKSAFAGMLMIATAQADTIWNVGLKTGAAQNFVTVSFIEKMLGGVLITWPQWFLAGVPFSVIMSVLLYFVLVRTMPPEVADIPGGQEAIKRQLAELGPLTRKESRLLVIALLLLAFWSTENILHRLDSATVTVLGVALMLLPGLGVMSWKEAQPKIPWGTIALFGVGISLGSALLSTRAAAWLADIVAGTFGLATMPPLGIIAVMMAFLILVHLGFASATALASAMIPIVIAILIKAQAGNPALNTVGLTLIIHFTVCFGFILPVNAPQNMVAYSTGTFEARDFRRTGFPLTLLAYVTVLVLSATYWKWLGLVTR